MSKGNGKVKQDFDAKTLEQIIADADPRNWAVSEELDYQSLINLQSRYVRQGKLRDNMIKVRGTSGERMDTFGEEGRMRSR